MCGLILKNKESNMNDVSEFRKFAMSRLSYDPKTGIFVWKLSTGRSISAGDVAGYVGKHGYSRIHVKRGVDCRAHRLAWLFVYGKWPDGPIDHISGDRSDNRIENLRDADPSINAQNKKRPSVSNKSGYLGVCRAGSKWQSQIQVDGKNVYIGRFDTPELAHKAYMAEKIKLHPGFVI